MPCQSLVIFHAVTTSHSTQVITIDLSFKGPRDIELRWQLIVPELRTKWLLRELWWWWSAIGGTFTSNGAYSTCGSLHCRLVHALQSRFWSGEFEQSLILRNGTRLPPARELLLRAALLTNLPCSYASCSLVTTLLQPLNQHNLISNLTIRLISNLMIRFKAIFPGILRGLTATQDLTGIGTCKAEERLLQFSLHRCSHQSTTATERLCWSIRLRLHIWCG